MVRLALATLAIVVAGVLGCARPASPTRDTAWVAERFIAARQSGNLDATMDCFAAQPEMRSSLGVSWIGRDAVRAIMAYRITDSYSVDAMQVVGNRVIWSEHVRRNVPGLPSASFDEDVEAVIAGNQIVRMVTYVGGAHPSTTLETTAAAPVGVDLLMPLTILLLVATAVLVWPPAPLAGPRAASGHLLAGLREFVARRG